MGRTLSESDILDLKNYLKMTAGKDMYLTEDCSVDDIAGGNVDDAYYSGRDDGETILARDILENYFGESYGNV